MQSGVHFKMIDDDFILKHALLVYSDSTKAEKAHGKRLLEHAKKIVVHSKIDNSILHDIEILFNESPVNDLSFSFSSLENKKIIMNAGMFLMIINKGQSGWYAFSQNGLHIKRTVEFILEDEKNNG